MMMALGMMTAGAQAQLRSGINLADLDKNVRPADDFYEYACGGWMKANPLPAAYSRYGSFDRLAEDNNKRINDILKELLENSYAKGTVEQQLSDLYKLAMDSARREKEGLAPVMPIIKQLDPVKLMDEESIQDIMEFYMGVNTIDRQHFIQANLRSEEELEDINL